MKKINIYHLIEQNEIQKKIIEDLILKILLLEEKIEIVKNSERCVDMCKTCGKLFLFTDSSDCCIKHDS